MARASRIVLDMALATGKAVKPVVGVVWQYAKIEMVPPLTYSFFHGPSGKALEQKAAKFAENILDGLEGKVKEIAADAARVVREKEAALKAVHDKAAAAARAAIHLRKEEVKRQQAAKQEDAKSKAESKIKEQKIDEPKAMAVKAKKKEAAAKPESTKKKEPARKKLPKTNRRETKKGSAPKMPKK